MRRIRTFGRRKVHRNDYVKARERPCDKVQPEPFGGYAAERFVLLAVEYVGNALGKKKYAKVYSY